MNYIQVFSSERDKVVVKCVVCDKECDTMDQFLIHEKSNKHIKKAERINSRKCIVSPSILTDSLPSSVNEGSQFLYSCKLCNTKCNTQDQLNAHNEGKIHAKKLLKTEIKNTETSDMSSSSLEDADKVKSLTNNPQTIKRGLPTEMRYLLTPERKHNFITCRLCNQKCNTQEQYDLHCRSTKHIKKLKTLNLENFDESTISCTTSDGISDDNEVKFCDVCQITIPINNIDSHFSGKAHKEKLVKSTPVALQSDSDVKKNEISPLCSHFDNLKLVPRKYQIEVYEKSLQSDCVIFLPTGTGKTFVACMLILKMLEENPHHRVAFLVDKVLLVMQQHDFFKKQFKNIVLKRFDSEGSVKERHIRLLGLANSYVNTEHTVSVMDHDIVVATAALYAGLLADKKLYWNQLCLVIFDEAHHCVKDHPYNKLLREYQLYPDFVLVDKTDINTQLLNGIPKVYEDKLQDWKRRRCKMVGLTASPAGTLDKEMTYKLLVELLQALGGVSIANVIENKEELQTFTSCSTIETRLVNYSTNESNLRDTMKDAFLFMLKKFERFITTSTNLMMLRDCRRLSVEDVAEFKSQLMNRLHETEKVEKATINHVLSIIDIIDDIDSFGYEYGVQRLKDLLSNENEKVWLADNVIQFVPQSEAIVNQPSNEKSSLIQAIIEETKNVGDESRTILLLVRERETARQLAKILTENCEGQKLMVLVGHGAGGSKGQKDNKGMSVTKQKKALKQIKEQQNQIIVATSVADEGLDLPDCDLVILINPPSSVQALVQVRGRARKKSSRLLMICRDQKCIDDLYSLTVKEKNIIESIDRILSGTGEQET